MNWLKKYLTVAESGRERAERFNAHLRSNLPTFKEALERWDGKSNILCTRESLEDSPCGYITGAWFDTKFGRYQIKEIQFNYDMAGVDLWSESEAIGALEQKAETIRMESAAYRLKKIEEQIAEIRGVSHHDYQGGV